MKVDRRETREKQERNKREERKQKRREKQEIRTEKRTQKEQRKKRELEEKNMHRVGFEPTRFTTVVLETTPLDRSGTDA